MASNDIKSLFYKMGTNLEAKACKILMIMYGISDENGNVNTSLTDLQQRSNMSISTIRSALKELEQKGILEINHKIGLETDYILLFLKKQKGLKIRIDKYDYF
ncbi:helix-turn-helix domain-containing protein [Thermaerobacillus caldiproteolyticus]|uniref:helix-turn-helix domain-containing protein n=1 Tax=Thermaerobacillus caldiproteolyticus TaxID=247480 RepID=UPI00188BB412|nr:helix-turn-helix domain-containing protein [Anoxybacillus caldiproteolyticus]QPA30056.1 helix-turn-helix domain-containing protein [Anoxybacillus caldiproteolyticus]